MKRTAVFCAARTVATASLLALLLSAQAAAQGRIVRDTIPSAAVQRNLTGDPSAREVLVYLPTAYDAEPERSFPVLYLLHGVTSVPDEWLDGSYQGFDLRAAMDSLIAAGMRPYIVVMPDANSQLGGNFYTNSASLGGWEDFIALELVRHMDSRYRTLPTRASRGLAGHSMGGFGALYLGARHAATFGHVYAMSPCCLGFTGELHPDSSVWRETASERDVASATPSARRVRMMAAAFTGAHPDTALRSIPFSIVDGKASPTATYETWAKHMPLQGVSRDTAAYRSLLSLTVEFGREDPISSVPTGSTALSRRLTEARVPHRLLEYDGGHIDRVRDRFERHVLPFFGSALHHQVMDALQSGRTSGHLR